MPRRPTALPELPEIVVTSPVQLVNCLKSLESAEIIGFDTEFVGEQSYRPELCLIQVSTEHSLFVIDALTCGSIDSFWKVLTEPGKTIVVHSGREDIRLCYFAIGQTPPNIFDVQIASGLIGLQYPIGYAGLVQELLGHRTGKGETLTDWRKRPLLPGQLRYAFDDVRFLLPSWEKLRERLLRFKRESWSREEFNEFARKAVIDELQTEKWRKIKGIGALDRVGLSVARGLFSWREGFARRLNRPPRVLLRDDLIIELARRPPKSSAELESLRGLPKGETQALLRAIEDARTLPMDQRPEIEARDFDPPNVQILGNLLSLVLMDVCSKLQLAPALVASGQDLKSIVRENIATGTLPDLPLTRGWRKEAILPKLISVLTGKSTIRVKSSAADDPLEYRDAFPLS